MTSNTQYQVVQVPLEDLNQSTTLQSPPSIEPSDEDCTGCTLHSQDCHTSCSASRRDRIQAWKDTNFPNSETACGTIAFKGDTRQSLAECVHLYHNEFENGPDGFKEDKLKAVYELITEQWNLRTPNHIVSVTGGKMKFDVDEEVLKDFKDNMRNISRTSRAWVITGGTHTGVMKHVSDALKCESDAICIGIPVFGKIANKGKLSRPSQSEAAYKRMFSYKIGSQMKAGTGVYLNGCHSHFIMYDDGQDEEYGGEIRFRAALENYLADQSDKPYVLVVLNGRSGTFQTICEMISYDRTVILVKGSGGVADEMAEVVVGGEISKKMEDYVRSKVENYQDKLDMCRKKSDLFVIAEKDGDVTIMDALTKALLSNTEDSVLEAEKLRLSLLWQDPSAPMRRCPVMEQLEKLRKSGIPEKDSENLKKLQDLLVLALARGNAAFVKILLHDYEVGLRDVISFDVLKLLYGYQSYERNFPKKYLGVNDHYYEDQERLPDDGSVTRLANYVYDYNKWRSVEDCRLIFSEEGVSKVRKRFFKYCPDIKDTRDTKVDKKCFKNCPIIKDTKVRTRAWDPAWELFIWSAVCNLPDVTKVLWPLGGDQLGKTLIASHYFEKLANDAERLAITDHDLNSYHKSKSDFTELSCHLLDDCYKADENTATKLIRQDIHYSYPNKTNLELAVLYRNHDFVAHSCVQKVLTDVWAGKLDIRQVASFRAYLCVALVIFFPFFMPMIVFNEEEIKKSDRKSCISKCIGNCTWKIKHFYSAPVVGFTLNLVFHVGFAALYSHVLVWEGPEMDFELSLKSWILYSMAIGYLTTEMYQISQYDPKNIFKKIKVWMWDYHSHNFWDIFNIGLLGIAYATNLHHNSTCHSRKDMVPANNLTQNVTAHGSHQSKFICTFPHYLHTINCAFWTLRITTYLRFFPRFGQYYEMVKLMLADLLGFIICMIIVFLTYGVFTTSIFFSHGGVKDVERPFLFLFGRPWFHVYGEYFLEMPENSSDSTESWFFKGKERDTAEEYLVWIALGIYLCITNIILLNIVIAVFNNTYTKVINKGRKIWRFNRYHVIIEYMKRCTSPPPFCVIQHAFLFLSWIFSGCRGKSMSTSEIMGSKMSVHRSTRCNVEKIKLSQYQGDRALRIFKQKMDIRDGKVVMKEMASQSPEEDTVLSTLKGLMTKADGHMKELREHLEDQQKQSEVQTKKIEQQISTTYDQDHQHVANANVTKDDAVLQELYKMMKKIDEQGEQIKELRDQLADQRTQIKEQATKAEEQTHKIDLAIKKIEEVTKKSEQQTKEIDLQSKETQNGRNNNNRPTQVNPTA